MVIHLLSLSTFEPHPRASRPVLEWPVPLYRRKISLGFQICDDGLFILHHNQPGPSHDMVCGWQWTTGRLAVVSDRGSAGRFVDIADLSDAPRVPHHVI